MNSRKRFGKWFLPVLSRYGRAGRKIWTRFATDWRKNINELDEDSVLADLGIRRLYFKEYKIFYKIEDEIHTVFIVRILHMRMNSRAWLYRTFGISE